MDKSSWITIKMISGGFWQRRGFHGFLQEQPEKPTLFPGEVYCGPEAELMLTSFPKDFVRVVIDKVIKEKRAYVKKDK